MQDRVTDTTRRWTVVVGALVVQVILGTVYAFSVFVKPLEQAFDWDRSTTQWAFSVALATFALVMIPAGRLQDRLGPRRVATAAPWAYPRSCWSASASVLAVA